MRGKKLHESLSRRERQVMNILFRRGEATVAEVMGDLADPPTYSAVRSVLRILAGKGLVTHREDGPRYVYLPAVNTERAGSEALLQVVKTFFEGRAEQAVTALLELSDADVDDSDLERIRQRIQAARRSGR
jgi:predicted transcriptional regulator